MKELDNISIILVRPKYAENIGSAARIALNMGISHLCVIGAHNFDKELARKTATHNAAHLLDSVTFAENISDLLVDYALLVGTTARVGRSRRVTALPDQLAPILSPYVSTDRVGLVFGPENSGLTNDELKHCGAFVTIPTAQFSSVNLAQSVGIIAYELRKGFLAAAGKKTDQHSPKPAKPQELGVMYSVAERLFERLDVVSGHSKAILRLKHMHQLLGRAVVKPREAKVIKDACRHLINALETGGKRSSVEKN